MPMAGQKGRGMGQGHRGRGAEDRDDERRRKVGPQAGLESFTNAKAESRNDSLLAD